MFEQQSRYYTVRKKKLIFYWCFLCGNNSTWKKDHTKSQLLIWFLLMGSKVVIKFIYYRIRYIEYGHAEYMCY